MMGDDERNDGSATSLPVLLAVVALALLGCEAPAESGASCARASECASSLVCRLGRCRAECRENRDCGAGRSCLLDATGAGACAVAEDVCAGSCVANLVCRDAVCVQSCASDGDCPRDGHCASDVCAPGSSIDAGTTSDAGPSDAGVRACVDDHDCPASDACDVNPSAGDQAFHVCRPRCTRTVDCASGSACIAADYRVDAGAGPPGICSTLCSPATGVGCPSGTTCTVSEGRDVEYASITFVQCIVPGARAECGDCDAYSCSTGMSCRYLHPGVSVCERGCVVGTTCPDGMPCEAGEPRYIAEGMSYGYCPSAACL
jgi:hypothetical protein